MAPQELLVQRQSVFDLFEPVAKRLSIQLRFVDELPALQRAREEMEEFLRRR